MKIKERIDIDDTLSVQLEGLHWKNIREIEDLSLEVENLNGINLLQIQNAYGKTTTLKLLRHIFTGELPPEESWFGYRYKKQFGGSLDFSEFKVDLSINDKKYTLGIKFNYVDNTCDFFTKSPHAAGYNRGWEPPREFVRKFHSKKEFVNLFVFDGEMAKDLNQKQGARIIENSIKEITDLHSVYDLVRSGSKPGEYGLLQQLFESALKTENIKNVDATQQTYLGYLKDCQDWIAHLENTAKEEEKNKRKMNDEYIKLNEQITELERKHKELGPKIDAANGELNQANQLLGHITQELLIALFNPANFNSQLWQDTKTFHSKLEKAKIPRSIGKQFLFEIMAEDNCICGTNWDKEMRKYAEQNLEKYLGDDLLGLIKGMQATVRENTHENDISTLKGNLITQIDNVKQIDQKLQDLRSLFDQDTQNELDGLRDKSQELHTEIAKIDDLILLITTTDDDLIADRGYNEGIWKPNKELYIHPNEFKNCHNVKSLKRVENHLKHLLGEMSGLLSLNEGIDALNEIVEKALKKTMDKLRNEAIQNANNFLSKIHATGGDLRIKSLENGLSFVNIYGDVQEDVNAAAQLAGAYSYVTAMYDLGEIKVPLILDSPVTGFSLGTANDWAREIPDKFPQVIAFITSMEKVGLWPLIENEDFDSFCCTIKRSDETVDGLPQSGKMVAEPDFTFFKEYEYLKNQPILERERIIDG